jgi:hypothetical protein
MPIQRRTVDPNAIPVVVAKKEYTPDSKARLRHVPKQNLRTAAFVGLGANEEPKLISIDDIATCLRLANNPGWHTEEATRNRIKGRLSAIRAFCILCADGPKGARMCPQVTCPLWAFRMGTNPFHRKGKK